jgi:hypothetical protein
MYAFDSRLGGFCRSCLPGAESQYEFPPRPHPPRGLPYPPKVRAAVGDISKARALLGWEPRITLKEGLSKSLEFFRSHLSAGWYATSSALALRNRIYPCGPILNGPE